MDQIGYETSFNLFLSVLDLKPDQCVHMYDSNGKLMSICLPRSKKQPSHAQECAVSFLWETERGHTRKEVDTSALWYQNKQCSNIKQNVGSDRLLQCIQTTKGLRPNRWSTFSLAKHLATGQCLGWVNTTMKLKGLKRIASRISWL